MVGSCINGQANAPVFRLTFAGAEVKQKIEQQLISLTLTDNRGFEADQLDIELDDADDQLLMPRRGVELSLALALALALGWAGKGSRFSRKAPIPLKKSSTAARRTG